MAPTTIQIDTHTRNLLRIAKAQHGTTYDNLIRHLLELDQINEKERAPPPLSSPAVPEEHVQNILSKFKRPGRR